MAATSADKLDQCNVLARGVLIGGLMNNMEVDKEVVGLGGTVVIQSGGVIGKELEMEECRPMMMVRNPKYGCTDKSLECVVMLDNREDGGSKALLAKSLSNLLGLQYNGKEAEVLSKIVELELKDKEIIGGVCGAILVWNIRGIGRSEKKRKIRKLLKERNVDIFLIQETKKKDILVTEVRAMWVRDRIERYILLSSMLFNSFECVVLNIYAPNEVGARGRFWDSLLKLKEDFPKPWCLCGDFNEIGFISEMKDCSRRAM
ncbi:hypothetical protein CsSME_00032846 [Camellia sinensis var. sinensis]